MDFTGTWIWICSWSSKISEVFGYGFLHQYLCAKGKWIVQLSLKKDMNFSPFSGSVLDRFWISSGSVLDQFWISSGSGFSGFLLYLDAVFWLTLCGTGFRYWHFVNMDFTFPCEFCLNWYFANTDFLDTPRSRVHLSSYCLNVAHQFSVWPVFTGYHGYV